MLIEQENDEFLIDLDLAIRLNDNTAFKTSSKIDTKMFMTIDALKDEHHNFMHDLKSFFWVLFWICIHWDESHQKRRIVTEFKNWNKKSIKKLAKLKIELILKDDFNKEIKINFSEYCKSLISCMQKLWKKVFSEKKRWLSENRELYFRVTDVLKRARKNFAHNAWCQEIMSIYKLLAIFMTLSRTFKSLNHFLLL